MLRKNVIIGFTMSLVAVICIAAYMLAGSDDTRVANAAMKGDREAVRTLLKQAADVNAAQGDGMTALHWAAMNNDSELAQLLLYAGANVRATTRIGGYTPLFMAAKNGASNVLDVLLKAECGLKTKGIDGLTPLMVAIDVRGSPDRSITPGSWCRSQRQGSRERTNGGHVCGFL